MEGKKILITGGAGFIGSHLAKVLSPKNYVTVIDNLANGSTARLQDTRVNFVDVDIMDLRSVLGLTKDIDYVFHLAGITGVDNLDCMGVNVKGTLNILEASSHVGRFIFASSAAVYGDADGAVDEHSPLNPISTYGNSKVIAEELCHKFGVPHTILRYFNVYGLGCRGVINNCMQAMRDGRRFTIYGDGRQTRDFVYIDNVVEATIKAAEFPVSTIFNIGSGESRSVAELAEIIGDGAIVRYKEARAYDIQNSVAVIDKAHNLLDYNPIKLEEGLARMKLCH